MFTGIIEDIGAVESVKMGRQSMESQFAPKKSLKMFILAIVLQ